MIEKEEKLPGTAEPQLGKQQPPTHRGWYSRGYLPHVDHPGVLQSITYRLADSLSKHAIEALHEKFQHRPSATHNLEIRQRLEALLDAGHGSCALRNSKAAECVVDTWKKFAAHRYDLIAWVVMPNHVHVLVRVYDGYPLGKIVQSWKSYTGRKIAELGLGVPREMVSGKNQKQSVWMKEYWDRFIRDEKHFCATVNYIHFNPVKAGFVKNPEDWPWSRAREFESNIKNLDL